MAAAPSPSSGIPWLLTLPHELTSEIVAQLATFTDSFSSSPYSPSSASKRPRFTNTSNPSHWDVYKCHKLTSSSLRDLQSLALVHTHLLPYCRSQLFRTLRIYPAMDPDRVTALLDLFTRSPELSRHVRGVWWSVAVEEYRVPYSGSSSSSQSVAFKPMSESLGPHSSYELFKRKTEEREVRKAQQRLELLSILAKDGRGLTRLWVTGCETQRKWDLAIQTRRGSAKRSRIAVEEEEETLSRGAVARTLGALLGSSPGVTLVSIVNLAFPAALLRGCTNMRDLRLGEDVRVIASNGFQESKASPSRKTVRPRALHLSKSIFATDTSALFEPRWLGFRSSSCSIIEDRTMNIISTPPLDLAKLQTLSCHFPSPEFSILARHLTQNDWGAPGDLEEVVLQVSDLVSLVEDLYTEPSSLLSLFEGRSVDRLALAITLPSSSVSGAPVPSAPTMAPPPIPPGNAMSPVSTMSDCISKLVTFLISHRTARNISVEVKASMEQGSGLLLNGIDLGSLVRRLSSESSISAGYLPSSRLDVRFLLSPGCYPYVTRSGIAGEDFGEGFAREREAGPWKEAVDVLSKAGVELNVRYDAVG